MDIPTTLQTPDLPCPPTVTIVARLDGQVVGGGAVMNLDAVTVPLATPTKVRKPRRQHLADCAQRLAELHPGEVACPHGLIVCPDCDACSCGQRGHSRPRAVALGEVKQPAGSGNVQVMEDAMDERGGSTGGPPPARWWDNPAVFFLVTPPEQADDHTALAKFLADNGGPANASFHVLPVDDPRLPEGIDSTIAAMVEQGLEARANPELGPDGVVLMLPPVAKGQPPRRVERRIRCVVLVGASPFI